MVGCWADDVVLVVGLFELELGGAGVVVVVGFKLANMSLSS